MKDTQKIAAFGILILFVQIVMLLFCAAAYVKLEQQLSDILAIVGDLGSINSHGL